LLTSEHTGEEEGEREIESKENLKQEDETERGRGG